VEVGTDRWRQGTTVTGVISMAPWEGVVLIESPGPVT